MFENAPPYTHGSQRRGKASFIVAELELVRFARAAMPETAPPLTRRMRDHRPRPGVQARVTFHVPRIDIGQPEVAAVGLHVESCDHARSPGCSARHRREPTHRSVKPRYTS